MFEQLSNQVLERVFALNERQTTVRRELLAGVSTFVTLSYILFVNPSILAGAGMDFSSVYVATCIAAAFGCLVMGLYANYPIALAPGMGLNAYFASAIVIGMGVSWQVALGAVFCSGVLFLLISVLPIREWIIDSIPASQKLAIAAGIGIFLIFIGLQSSGIVEHNPATLLAIGDLAQWTILLVVIGFATIVGLERWRVPGVIFLTILALAVIGWLSGLAENPESIFAFPPVESKTFLELDVIGALELGLLVVVFSLLMVDLFDTSGTLIALLREGELMDEKGKIPELKRALVADSSATVVGAFLGTSTTTSYIESGAGIRAGGRTGLTAVTVGGLMLLMLFFEPLAGAIPGYAVAPAILFVGCLMMRSMRNIEWEELTEAIPAMVTVVAIPFTFSIATGIGLGVIAYVLIKLVALKGREIHPAMGFLFVVFAVKFAFDV